MTENEYFRRDKGPPHMLTKTSVRDITDDIREEKDNTEVTQYSKFLLK